MTAENALMGSGPEHGTEAGRIGQLEPDIFILPERVRNSAATIGNPAECHEIHGLICSMMRRPPDADRRRRLAEVQPSAAGSSRSSAVRPFRHEASHHIQIAGLLGKHPGNQQFWRHEVVFGL